MQSALAITGAARDRYTPRSAILSWCRSSFVGLALASGDLIAVMAAFFCAALLINIGGFNAQPIPPLTAFLFLFPAAAIGLYSRTASGAYERFRKRVIVTAGCVPFIWLVALPADNIGDFLIVRAWEAPTLLVFGHYVEAIIRRLLGRLGYWGAATVLVGCSSACKRLAHLLASRPEFGLTPVGLIATDGPPSQKLSIQPTSGIASDFRVINPTVNVEVAIFASTRDLAAVLTNQTIFGPHCRLLLAKDIYRLPSLWLRTRTLGPLVGIEIRRDLDRWYNRLLKRAFDLAFAIPLGAMVLPIVGLLAVVIKVADPGPAFYIQHRIGRGGATIRLLKLRTMYSDADRRLEVHLRENPEARAEWHRFYKLQNDPRIVPFVGDFIRRFSLDELPQIWNVIRGDMSFVGPRPLPAYHADRFDKEFKRIRISLMPGITGLWQISTRSNGDLRSWVEQDSFYIRNWSLWLDFYILLETLPAVLGAKGAR